MEKKVWKYFVEFSEYVNLPGKIVYFLNDTEVAQKKLKTASGSMTKPEYPRTVVDNEKFKLRLENSKPQVWLEKFKGWFTIGNTNVIEIFNNLDGAINISNGEFSGDWSIIANRDNPLEVTVVREASKAYKKALSEANRCLDLEIEKATKKWVPGKSYNTKLGVLTVLGKVGSFRSGYGSSRKTQNTRKDLYLVTFDLDTTVYTDTKSAYLSLPLHVVEDPTVTVPGKVYVFSKTIRSIETGNSITANLGATEDLWEECLTKGWAKDGSIEEIASLLDYTTKDVFAPIPESTANVLKDIFLARLKKLFIDYYNTPYYKNQLSSATTDLDQLTENLLRVGFFYASKYIDSVLVYKTLEDHKISIETSVGKMIEDVLKEEYVTLTNPITKNDIWENQEWYSRHWEANGALGVSIYKDKDPFINDNRLSEEDQKILYPFISMIATNVRNCYGQNFCRDYYRMNSGSKSRPEIVSDYRVDWENFKIFDDFPDEVAGILIRNRIYSLRIYDYAE